MDKKAGRRIKRIGVRLILLLVILSGGCQYAGQKAATKKQSWSFDYHETVLDNGLRVITLEDFSCPIVTVELWYHVGSKDERPDRQGFAHMFEHIMFKGTDRVGPEEHFNYIRQTGGTTNAYTGFDRTVYLETLPGNQLELALWLEAERTAFLKIDQNSFDTERKVVEEERRLQLNETYGTAIEKLMAELYKTSPYRWMPIGNIAHLRATSVQELRGFWMRNYVPNNATLIMVGAVKHEQAHQLAKRYFGWIRRYETPKKPNASEPLPTAKRSITIKEDNAPAPVAGLVWRTVAARDKDAVVLDLLASILGGGNSSRLYRQLVAEKQLAAAVEAESYNLEEDGVFGAGAVLSPRDNEPNEVLKIIEAEIDRLRKEPVTEDELTKARNQILKRLVTESLTDESKARMLGNAAVVEGDTSRVNRYLNEVRAVRAEDLMRAAKTYLANERMLRVTVEQNPAGSISDGKKAEIEAPITAQPEKQSPLPGRRGTVRPGDFPAKAPFAKIKALKPTQKFTSWALLNGLKVMVVPNHEVPFVSIHLGLLAGAWTEQKPGTAAMAIRMLTKGTQNYTEGQLAEELETYAILLQGRGEMDTSSVRADCLSEHAPRAMKLLGEVVLRPTFAADEFQKLRKQVLTGLAVSSQEPEYIADKEFRRCLYGKHPYSRTATGEINDVKTLEVNDLKEWWGRFIRPDMAVLIFAGDIKVEKARKLAAESFEDWQPREPKRQIMLPQLTWPQTTQIYLVDKPGSVQSQIRVGQPGITRHHPAYFVSKLVSNYFGFDYNSRLNANIRVAKGLTYSVWGGYIPHRFAGEFMVNTFSKTETTAETVRAVLEEIERLKGQGPSENELERNRSFILGSFVRTRETPQDIGEDLWLIESERLGKDYLDRFLKGAAAAKANDCERFIAQKLVPSKMVIVVVGDAMKLKEPLSQIAPVTVLPSDLE